MDIATTPQLNTPLSPDERLDVVNEQIRLIQKKQGLTYGTDAFLLASYIRTSPSARAVDLGSGTGIIPLLLIAKEKVATVTAVEIQECFADLIARNAKINGFADRIVPLCRDLRELNATDLGGEVDLVFSNPPYMRCDSGKKNESQEKYIARHEVHGSISDFCAAAARILRYGGKFVTVWRPDRLNELLYALHASGMEAKRMTFVHADAHAEPCAVLTEAIKGGAPAVRISPPLLLYRDERNENGTRQLTEEAQLIYEKCAFPSYER
jgi:tRNA1Val (adenine37-N6)-methyltransferase